MKDLTNRGPDGRFKKGSIPFNKGKKGVNGFSSTRFKKGHKTHNFKEVGSLRFPSKPKDYVMIKVANPNKWRLYHVVVWEREHKQKVPKNGIIIFVDGTIEILNQATYFL